MKRGFDLIGASILFLVAALPMLGIAIAIWLSGAESVFFRQWRMGYKGIPFRIWKFRTMKVSEQDTPSDALVWEQGDNRVTTIGRFLRRTHLDELPQLWNVIRGDMSLVGPRPMIPLIWKEFEERCPGLAILREVRPGLTGAGQICGRLMLRDDPGYVRGLDIEYANIKDPWQLLCRDVRIIWQTIPVVLCARGI